MTLEDRARIVKAVFMDVDGVLTDGKLWIGPNGEFVKVFDSKDGLGIRLLLEEGIEVILVTGRKTEALEVRARDLGITEVHQGIKDKEKLVRELAAKKQLKKEEICAIGDDLPDIAMFRCAGFRVAVADGVKEVREQADMITKQKGGNGAVREVCEIILKAKNKWK